MNSGARRGYTETREKAALLCLKEVSMRTRGTGLGRRRTTPPFYYFPILRRVWLAFPGVSEFLGYPRSLCLLRGEVFVSCIKGRYVCGGWGLLGGGGLGGAITAASCLL